MKLFDQILTYLMLITKMLNTIHTIIHIKIYIQQFLSPTLQSKPSSSICWLIGNIIGGFYEIVKLLEGTDIIILLKIPSVVKFIGLIFIINLIMKLAVFELAITPLVNIHIKIIRTLITRATVSFGNNTLMKYP